MPVETFESLPSVFFSRNSFLLQLNQTETLDAVAKHLLSPARRGAPVRVEAVKASGGSTAFIDYLCERRGAEVARFLTERGVETTLMTMKNVESSSPIDAGEVRLLVEVLPLPVAPAAAPTNAVVPASGTALP